MNPNFRPPIIPNPNQGFFFRPPPNVPNQPPAGVNIALPLQRPNLPPPPGANLPPPPRPNFPLQPPVANLPPPPIPKVTSISTPPVQIIDEALPAASSSPAASSPSNNNRPMALIMGKEQSTSQKTAKPPPDRQFGFSKPTPTQINAQIGEIKQKFGEYSIAECREKVDWLSSLCIQQQLDLDLLRSTAWTFEDWTSRELRKFGKIRKDNGILTSQKKKLQETDRKNQKEMADLRTKMSTEKAEFEAKIEKLESEMRSNATNFQMTKNSLEKEVHDLKPFKEKCKRLALDAETLKSENTKMKKDLDGLMAEKERYGKMVDPNKLEEALRERDESRKKCAELKQERATWKEKVDKLEKKLTAEMQKKKGEKSKTPEGEEEDEEKEKDRRVKLTAKDAEIAKLREELAEKDEELKNGKEEAKHKYFQLKEKLQKKRADCEKLKEDCRKEQEYREKAEMEAEKANKELAKLRKKMEEMKQQQHEKHQTQPPTQQKEEQKSAETTTTGKSENKKLLLESLQKRVQECAAKKAEMEKLISPLLAKMSEGKCENCVKYEEYFNRAQKRSSELTTEVFTKNMEIAELRGRVKEKENSNDDDGGNLDGPQKQQQQRMAPKNGQLGGIQQQQSRGHKRKAGDGQGKEGDDPPVVAQKQQKSISAASILLLDTEMEQHVEKQQQQPGKEQSKFPNLAESQISPSLPAAAPDLVNSSSSVILLSVNTSSTPPPTSPLPNQSIVGQQSLNNAFGRSISQQPLTNTAQHPINASYRPSSVPNDRNTSPMLKRVQTSQQIARTSPHLNRPQIKEPLMDMDEPASVEEETADQPSAQQQQQDDGGSTNSDAQDQIKTMAARIVTNFLLFLGQPQNIQRNARALIPEFIQLHNLPSMQLISDQLALIAEEAERGKAERARLANANNNRGA